MGPGESRAPFLVYDVNFCAASFVTATDAPWLVVSPTSGSFLSGGQGQITPTTLPFATPGQSATITVTADGGSSVSITVTVQ
jgi:hypothetical protein